MTFQERAHAVVKVWSGIGAMEGKVADAIREAVIEEHNAVVLMMQAQLEDAVRKAVRETAVLCGCDPAEAERAVCP